MALHQNGRRDIELQNRALLAQEWLRQEQAVSREAHVLEGHGLVACS